MRHTNAESSRRIRVPLSWLRSDRALLKLSGPTSRLSIISSAISSDSGKLSTSPKHLSRRHKISSLALSRLKIFSRIYPGWGSSRLSSIPFPSDCSARRGCSSRRTRASVDRGTVFSSGRNGCWCGSPRTSPLLPIPQRGWSVHRKKRNGFCPSTIRKTPSGSNGERPNSMTMAS